jgi:endonuclease/exonuclease/phosphatase family metal-dependent hydrolase
MRRLLTIAALSVAYALVVVLGWIFGKKGLVAIALVAIALALAWYVGAFGLRVGTYNIRRFGVEPTDMDQLARVIERADVDVLAVQEIQDEEKLRKLAARLGRYKVALSRCGGRSAMRLGFLYDDAKLTLERTDEYPELDPDRRGDCGGERPGFLGVFRRGSRTIDLLSVHFVPGGDRERMTRRKEQWEKVHRIVAALRAGGAEVIVLGDVNATGYLDDANGERTFIDARAREAGLGVASSDLACSEYARRPDGVLGPSLLDHVVATPLTVAPWSIDVRGYCAELKCAPHTGDPPGEFARVSDHCPVTFRLTR